MGKIDIGWLMFLGGVFAGMILAEFFYMIVESVQQAQHQQSGMSDDDNA